jgi:HlyD family secretion protein
MKRLFEKDMSRDWRGFALAGYGLILFTFGIMGLWAVIAKVDKAVVAGGWVSVETNKKTLQHLEGGLVKEIFVKEGQHVSKGEPLIRLESTQAKANSDILTNQVMSALAIESRLLAERDGKQNIEWPSEFADYKKSLFLIKLVEDEERQFRQRRETLSGQLNIIST